jgi:hypothetical protein
MGTKVSSSFAYLFVLGFENIHLYTWPLQPTVWVQYIDDFLYMWPLIKHGFISFRKIWTCAIKWSGSLLKTASMVHIPWIYVSGRIFWVFLLLVYIWNWHTLTSTYSMNCVIIYNVRVPYLTVNFYK